MRARVRRYRRTLVARTFFAGAGVLLLIFVLLIVTPIEISAPIRVGEAAILLGGLLVMLIIQLLLIRRVMAPLSRLADQMQHVDLREPRLPLIEPLDQATEIAAFIDAFNDMLRRLADERRRSARAALGAQEAERLRTARELHDEVGQSLTAVALQVEQLAAAADPATADRLNEMAQQLQDSLDDLRRIVRKLRPEALDDLGLLNALIALTSRVNRGTKIRIERELNGKLPALSPEQELVIYRVAQEALTNVVRHADARTVRIALFPEDGDVVLTVDDDGRGLPRAGVADGSGIEGMRERALLVGAQLSIDSKPSQGTEVKLVVPVDAEL
jgi:two-component system sensor histidine kinase UhpB